MAPKTLSSSIAHSNPWYRIRQDRVAWPSGHEGDYFVIEGWESVAIIAIRDQKLLTVKQFRYPIQMESVEIPMGRMEPDETPEQAALRELREETGYRAAKLTKLGTIFPINGLCHNPFHIFLAENFSELKQELDPQEAGMTKTWTPLDEWRDMIRSGHITDADTLACWALYLTR